MKQESAEEQPKKKLAKRVITPKRKYFVPGRGEIEATDLADVEKQLKKIEDGDGNK